MSKRKYRVAVVGGCGAWGRSYLKAYHEHPDTKIVALVDNARERRQPFVERYEIENVFDTVEYLLKEDLPDIVSVIVPTGINPDIVIACAEAGVKVVSCEKPIAIELSKADEMIRICRERGTSLGAGTAYWEIPYLLDVAQWVQEGNIGELTKASMPGGIPREVSGAGCVQFTFMRVMTGMEVVWVEGYTNPPEAADTDEDSEAYGRIGLSGGIVCELIKTTAGYSPPCSLSVTGTNGKVWLVYDKPILIKGTGNEEMPQYPEFFQDELPDAFISVIERLMRAFDAGGEAQCSGHDYRQALEIAIALKLSARQGHKRIILPLEDRSVRVRPNRYREFGGDKIGWNFIGMSEPPEVL